MEIHEEIIKEICKGNGESFKVKDILMASIRENKEDHKEFFKRLGKGDTWFGAIKTQVRIQWILILILFGVLITNKLGYF